MFEESVLLSEFGERGLEVFDVVPADFEFVDFGSILDVSSSVGVFDRREGFREIELAAKRERRARQLKFRKKEQTRREEKKRYSRWRDTGDHEGVSVSSERVLEKTRQLRVSVRDMSWRANNEENDGSVEDLSKTGL